MSRSSDVRTGGTTMRRAAQGGRHADAKSGAKSVANTEGVPPTPLVPELPDFDPEDVDPDELRDFMSDDWVEVKADPGFRERLRTQLWRMLRTSHHDDERDDED